MVWIKARHNISTSMMPTNINRSHVVCPPSSLNDDFSIADRNLEKSCPKRNYNFLPI